jgi:hypothetical protein
MHDTLSTQIFSLFSDPTTGLEAPKYIPTAALCKAYTQGDSKGRRVQTDAIKNQIKWRWDALKSPDTQEEEDTDVICAYLQRTDTWVEWFARLKLEVRGMGVQIKSRVPFVNANTVAALLVYNLQHVIVSPLVVSVVYRGSLGVHTKARYSELRKLDKLLRAMHVEARALVLLKKDDSTVWLRTLAKSTPTTISANLNRRSTTGFIHQDNQSQLNLVVTITQGLRDLVAEQISTTSHELQKAENAERRPVGGPP